ncbi:MAG: hypothetical protein U0105_13610 [Candidatus Obscuribacterales bacterium]
MSNRLFIHENGIAQANTKMETPLRLRLKTLGFADQPAALERAQQFCGALNQPDPDRAFACAVDILTKAALVFALIEEDNFRKLSFAELKEQTERASGASFTILAWMLQRFYAITALVSDDPTTGLSRYDILMARNLFRGLDYAHHHFDAIAPDSTATTLHDQDILLYVWSCGASLEGDIRRGLLQVASFLQAS